MATKILGTKLEYTDVQFLLGLAKDAKQRRIVQGLFDYQLKQIEQNHLLGIDNCKQLHNTWMGWITKGCRADMITSYRNHHGFKARIQYAQRLYITYVQKGDLVTARKWRDTVTTVLRSYQVCGPSKDDMSDMWNDSIKNNITQPMQTNSEIALIRGCCGIPSRYNEPCEAEDVYICASTIKSYFDMIEKVPFDARKGFYRNLSRTLLDLKPDDYSLLIKKGPHKYQGKTLTSIFGQSIDVHALNRPLSQGKIPLSQVTNNPDQFTDVGLFVIPQNTSLLACVDSLNEEILKSYKTSIHHYKNRSLDLTYNPQIPQGTIPASIEAAQGRTVLLQDKAGKTRPISIATYTVNNAFAPLHNALFKTLRRIRQDSTDQDKGISHIIEMTSKSDSYICSADLSSATDRLPVALQAYIIYRILKLSNQNCAYEIAHYWYVIMTETQFQDPVDPKSYFTYGAGQPMGVYTSWPMLGLTNHIMIRAAYWKCCDKSLDYLVCGDDTVIGSKEPFELYERWMNSLGVKINRSKSHICKQNDPIKVAEFCKRLAVNGEIVSSESPKVLIRASRDPAYQPGAIDCIQSIIGPISNRKLASLVNSRLENRKLYLPFRYGGWGQIGSDSLPEVLLADNFIFLYIYKKMRSSVSALETVMSTEAPEDFRSIDLLSRPLNDNPYQLADKDWRLMGKKVYTPMNLCRDYLYNYEQFIIGHSNLQPSEIVSVVRDTFNQIDKCIIPLRLSSSIDENMSKSQLAIRYQRMYTRTMRNLSSGNVHTFSEGVQPISIDIDWTDEPEFTDQYDLVSALDELIFR